MGAEKTGKRPSDAPAEPADAGRADGRRVVPVTTMRDIAAAADVSQSTVSRVLSGVATRVPIAAETRERVIAGVAPARLPAQPAGARAARRLDEPDRRGGPRLQRPVLRRGRSRPGRGGDGARLQRRARARSRRLDEAIPLTSVLETRHTDAIVLLGDMRVHPQLLDDLRNSRVPVVALWQGTSPLEFPTADTDDRAGIRAGLEHLVALGHGRIAFVSAELPGDFSVARGRVSSSSCGSGSAGCRRLSRTLPQHDGRRRRGAAPAAGPARPADRGGDLDRPDRRRGPARGAQPRRRPCRTGCRWSASTTS